MRATAPSPPPNSAAGRALLAPPPPPPPPSLPARSSLQLFLGTREALSREQTAEEVRLGALELMAALYYAQGRFLGIGVQETVAAASKYCVAK